MSLPVDVNTVVSHWATFSEDGEVSPEKVAEETMSLAQEIISHRDDNEMIGEYVGKIKENLSNPKVIKHLREGLYREGSYSTTIASGSIVTGRNPLTQAVHSLGSALLDTSSEEGKACGELIQEEFPPPREGLPEEVHGEILSHLTPGELSSLSKVGTKQGEITKKFIVSKINKEHIPLRAFGISSVEEAISFFGELSKDLTHLDTSGWDVTDEDCEKLIESFPKLHHLLINSSKISDIGILQIAEKMPNLTSLNISWCPGLTDQAILQIAEKMPNLTSLNISWCRGVTDQAILQIAKMPNLTSLNISGCVNVTDQAFLQIAKMPNLTSLNIIQCWGLTDQAFLQIAKMPNLTSLNISGCWGLTDQAFLQIAEKMPNLTSLNISVCRGVTDQAFLQIAEKMPNLTSLNISGCPGLTDQAILQIAKMSNLTSLNIHGCNFVTGQAILQIDLRRVTVLR